MSFGAEIRDFITAYKAGKSIVGSATDDEYKRLRNEKLKKDIDNADDPEGDALDLKIKQANLLGIQKRNAEIGVDRNAGLRSRREKLLDLQMKAFEDAQKPKPSRFAPAPSTTPAPSAVPVNPAPSPAPASPPQAVSELEDEEAPAAFASCGGAVKRFADGGFVEADDEEDAPEEEVEVASLEGGAAPVSRGYSPLAAHDAAAAGVTYAANHHGLTQRSAVPTLASMTRQQAYHRGDGAATPEEMEELRQMINPKGELSEAETNMKALSTVYSYYLKNGQPEQAKRVAASMMMSYKQAFDQYSKIAAQAGKEGNVDLATQALIKAYSNVPDGNEIQVIKGPNGQPMYQIKDSATGKVTQRGIAEPKAILEWATNHPGFEELLMQGDAQRNGKGAGKPQRVGKDARTELHGHIDSYANALKEAKKDVKPEEVQTLKNISDHIHAANPDMVGDEPFQASLKLLRGEEGKDFKITKGKDGGNHTIELGDGSTLELSDKQLRPIIAQRGKIAKELAEKEKADKKAKAESDARYSAVGDAAKGVGEAAGEAARYHGGKLGTAVEGIAEGVRSVGSSIGGALDTARKYINPDEGPSPFARAAEVISQSRERGYGPEEDQTK